MKFASGSFSFSFWAFIKQNTVLITPSVAFILGKEVVKEGLALKYISNSRSLKWYNNSHLILSRKVTQLFLLPEQNPEYQPL